MRVQDSAELVAIDVFQQAEQSGQRVTLALVEQRVAELLAHPPACGCGRCEAAAKVRVAYVYKIAETWQCAVTATRRRAVRDDLTGEISPQAHGSQCQVEMAPA